MECRELVWNLVSSSNQVKVDNSGLPIVWEECFGGEGGGSSWDICLETREQKLIVH